MAEIHLIQCSSYLIVFKVVLVAHFLSISPPFLSAFLLIALLQYFLNPYNRRIIKIQIVRLI